MMFLISLFLLLLSSSAHTQYVIPFNQSHPLGPDGPWLPVSILTGAPLKILDTYPTINSMINWFVSTENCLQPNQSCLDGQPNYYDLGIWSAGVDFNFTKNTSSVPYGQIFDGSSESVNITDSFGYWHAESFTFPNRLFLGNISQVTSNNTNIVYPGGMSYVPISTFTLNPMEPLIPTKENGTMLWSNILAGLQALQKVSSLSWTMHIGSVAQRINGSLVIGGYDQSHLIEAPGTFSGNIMPLTGITLGTGSGVSPWTSEYEVQNFLGNGSGNTNTINTSFEPSLPYLFLPSNVCSALAAALPIVYNSDLNLYTWNTNSPVFEDIVTSPSYLNFTFSSGGNHPIFIRIPFALLNLTLEAPLVAKPTQYFPCSPTSPQGTNPFLLGRAFLQAALIGQSTDSGVFWLAQAPGPSVSSSSLTIKELSASNPQLQLSPAPPSWEQTWADTLKPLASSHAQSSGDASTATSGLSGGAIAGIVIGVLALIALACVTAFFVMRARRRKRQAVPMELDNQHKHSGPSEKKSPMLGSTGPRLVEAPAYEPSETPGWSPSEVPGDGHYDWQQDARYEMSESRHVGAHNQLSRAAVPRAELHG